MTIVIDDEADFAKRIIKFALDTILFALAAAKIHHIELEVDTELGDVKFADPELHAAVMAIINELKHLHKEEATLMIDVCTVSLNAHSQVQARALVACAVDAYSLTALSFLTNFEKPILRCRKSP